MPRRRIRSSRRVSRVPPATRRQCERYADRSLLRPLVQTRLDHTVRPISVRVRRGIVSRCGESFAEPWGRTATRAAAFETRLCVCPGGYLGTIRTQAPRDAAGYGCEVHYGRERDGVIEKAPRLSAGAPFPDSPIGCPVTIVRKRRPPWHLMPERCAVECIVHSRSRDTLPPSITGEPMSAFVLHTKRCLGTDRARASMYPARRLYCLKTSTTEPLTSGNSGLASVSPCRRAGRSTSASLTRS